MAQKSLIYHFCSDEDSPCTHTHTHSLTCTHAHTRTQNVVFGFFFSPQCLLATDRQRGGGGADAQAATLGDGKNI